MARSWIVPTGKTQTELDAEATAENRSRATNAAREYLRDTDHEVIKAVEELLASQGLIDARLVADRAAARETITDG